jgi:signal transduction histidine kinase
LFALTAAAVVGVFGVVAYRAVHASTLEAAHARLRAVVVQIDTIMELGVRSQIEMLGAAAADPAVAGALRSPASALTPAATHALERLRGAAETTDVVLVWPDGRTRHVAGPNVGLDARAGARDIPASPAVGPMYRRDDVLHFEATAPVKDGSQTRGAIRVIRHLGAGSANRRIASNLLGESAVWLVGNAGGELFRNGAAVAYPLEAGAQGQYRRDGEAWLSASAPVAGTPWLIAIDLPERTALAPARAVLLPFVIAGLLTSLAGALIGVRVSRTMTRPLSQLTEAAEAIARGERDVRLVETHRSDEIGRLARAFATMAGSVRGVQDRLEAEVDARRDELGRAVARLRHLDEELRKSQRLATLGQLSSSVGHELRNPLGVMSTVVFMLDALPDASPKLKSYAGLLREQIRLSDRIISDLLDRARSGRPQLEPVDIGRLVDERLAHAAIPATIRVVRLVDPLPPLVLDGDRVGQIVWNLITNAIQAMSDGEGTLTVAVLLQGSRLRVEVRDTGPGVPRGERDRIFEPLFTTKTHGVGLGLSISRAFARASGGDLYIEDGPAGGSTFVLELPAALAASPEAAEPAAGEPAADDVRPPGWGSVTRAG